MPNEKQHAILLACFDGIKSAADARGPLETQLQSSGDIVLDTVVFKTDANHKPSVYDPRRVRAGTLTPAVTWGLFGLVTGTAGIASLVFWAVIGAVCGGLFAYFSEHALTKNQLTRIGARLPAQSSALLTFVETSDPRSLLEATAAHALSVASVAVIDDDLSAQVFTEPADRVEQPGGSLDRALPLDQKMLLNMIMLRYPAPETAQQVAFRIAEAGAKAANPLQVELVIETDRSGRRHVSDPTHGVRTWSKSNMISWGGFGLVFGAIAGAIGGGGILGLLGGGLLTGVAWGLFGLGAGVLYGMWAGTAITARRLKSLAHLLPPETSTLLVWADGSVSPDTIDTLAVPGSQRLVLRFNRVEHGAVLEAS